jgi:thiol-disulfide isomerase/thioredoxin
MSKQTYITFGVLLLILFMAAVAVYVTQRGSDMAQYEESEAFRVLTTPEGVASFTDTEGNPVTLTSSEPVSTVVYSWASWCVSCGQGLVAFNDFASSLASEPVSFIAVNRKEDARIANRYLNTLPELSAVEVVLDPEDYFFESAEGYAVPEVLVFSPEGELLLQSRGTFNASLVQDALNN